MKFLVEKLSAFHSTFLCISVPQLSCKPVIIFRVNWLEESLIVAHKRLKRNKQRPPWASTSGFQLEDKVDGYIEWYSHTLLGSTQQLTSYSFAHQVGNCSKGQAKNFKKNPRN